jgi:hypothetical protein
MRKTLLGSFAALAIMAAAGPANAQFDIGASAGFFLPSSGEVRGAFGSSIFKFGIGGVGRQSTGNLKMGTQLDFITANKNGNRMFIAPFTFNVEQALSLDQSSNIVPYVKAFAGLAYIDYGITRGGLRFDEKVIRPTYGIEGGVVVTDRIRLSARYNMFPKTGGFDFSGLTVAATISLLR